MTRVDAGSPGHAKKIQEGAISINWSCLPVMAAARPLQNASPADFYLEVVSYSRHA